MSKGDIVEEVPPVKDLVVVPEGVDPVVALVGAVEERETVGGVTASGSPPPKGAFDPHFFFQFSKMREAMKRHIPSGYAAKGETLKPPDFDLPIVACRCRCPQSRGNGPE